MSFFFFSGIQVSFVIEAFQILCEDGKPDESESVDLRRRRKCSCSESTSREVQGCRWEKWGKMVFVEVSFVFLLFRCRMNNQRNCTGYLIYTFQFYFLLFPYFCTDWACSIQCKHSSILHSNCFLSVLSWKARIHPFFMYGDYICISAAGNCFLVHRSSCVCSLSLSILDETWDDNPYILVSRQEKLGYTVQIGAYFGI